VFLDRVRARACLLFCLSCVLCMWCWLLCVCVLRADGLLCVGACSVYSLFDCIRVFVFDVYVLFGVVIYCILRLRVAAFMVYACVLCGV